MQPTFVHTNEPNEFLILFKENFEFNNYPWVVIACIFKLIDHQLSLHAFTSDLGNSMQSHVYAIQFNSIGDQITDD